MKITSASAFIFGFFSVLVIWWLTLFYFEIKDSPFNLAFAFAYGLIPILGGFFGLVKAKKWGFLKSSMGKSISFLSSGLLTWGLGEMIWSYYNFVLKVEIPYPSWADASFILSWPLWTVGVIFLSVATGVKFGLRKISGRLIAVTIPVFAILASYYLQITVARQGSFEISGGVLKIFFDLEYPIWDVIVLTFALLTLGLSFKFLGGKFKWPILITLFGFVLNYFADMAFSYTTTIGTHYNGNWVDLLFTLAMFVLSFGVNLLDIKDE